MNHETGTSSHLDRMGLTARLCSLLDSILEEHEIEFQEYGQNVILAGNSSMAARWRKLDVKLSDVVLMTKFSPDYLVHHRPSGKLFLMDAKASITPMFFPAAVQRLKEVSGNYSLDRHRIGEVEREAWDNYRNRFPPKKVAICFACPYNPNLVLCEWASELEELYRFQLSSNEAAAGSKTPHVNVDLGAMRRLDEFVADELGIKLDTDMFGDLLDEVKSWGLNKPQGRVTWFQFNSTVLWLRGKCPWIKGRIPKGATYDSIRRKFAGLQTPYDEIEIKAS